MDTRKVAALYLCSLAVLGGAVLVGGPVLGEIVAAANQPEFEVESVELSETEIETGDSVEVIATVENDGEAGGTHTVTLEADGEERQSKTVEVEADSTQTVTFEETFQEPGSYEITVNGEEGEELEVDEPGELIIDGASTYFRTITTEQSLAYSVSVTNVGDTRESSTVELTADGRTVDDEQVELSGGQSQSLELQFAPQQTGTYDMRVETDDDVYNSGVVEVVQPAEPEFEVADATLSDERILTGERTTVSADVRNVGNAEGSFVATLYVDGESVAGQRVRLDAGEATTVGFRPAFQSAGEYDVAVEDTQAGTVTVQEPADLAVVDAAVQSDTVTRGETLFVEARVENRGDVRGQTTLTLQVDGRPVTSVDVAIGGESSSRVELSHEFSDTGEKRLSVNGEDAGTVTVLTPAQFELSDASVSDNRIQVGERLSISATVENTGDVGGVFTANLIVDGETVSSKPYRIDGGESGIIGFERQFDEPGEYTIHINEARAGTVTVLEPASLSVTSASKDRSEVTTGESVSIEATVENRGDVTGETTVALDVDGSAVKEKTVELAGGASTTVEFTQQFAEAGEYNIGVNDESAGQVTVLAPADLSVTRADTGSDEITTEETLSIQATVANTGDISGETDVDLRIDGNVVDSTQVSVDGSGAEQVEFSHQFAEPGEYNIGVNDESAGQVTALAPADLSVTRADTGSDEITTEETLSVQATVANTGDVAGETSVDLRIDGNVVDTRQVSVEGQGAKQVELSHQFGSTGDRPVAVNDVSAGAVSVLAPANFELTGATLGEDSVLTGETVRITADVRNTGDVEGSYETALRVDGDPVESKSLTLAGGESGELSFERAFETAGDYSLGVGGEPAGTVTALAPADLSVVDAETEATQVTTEERISVDAVVENAGDVAGETEVALEVNGTVVASEPVTVDGADRTRVNFTHGFTETGEKRLSVNGADAGEVAAVAPASFDVSDGAIGRERPLPGETVTVTAEVENLGGVEGTFTPTLTINGETVEVRSLTLGPEESQQVTFRPTFESAGSYDIRVNGVRAGEVTVEQPAAFTITETTLTERTVLENSTIGISGEVANTGDRDGQTTVELRVGTTVVDEQAVDIAAGRSADVSFEHRFTSPGEYEVRLGDAVAGTVSVDQPATLALTDARVNTTESLRGNPVEVTAIVSNSGDRNGSYEAVVSVDGETVDSRTVTVPPESNESVRITHSLDAVGERTVSVGNATAGTVSVSEPPEFDVERAVVPADWAVEGGTAMVRTVVENPSEWTVSRTINVTVDEREVAAKNVRLEPGERREVEIQFQASNGTVRVDGVEAGRIDSSRFYEETGTAEQPDSGGIASYPILSLVAVLGVIIVGWFVLSVLGIINWRD